MRWVLITKLKTVLGVADDDKNVRLVVGTFQELIKISSFGPVRKAKKVKKEVKSEEAPVSEPFKESVKETKFGISYTINLNLPPTTEIEVYNAIFKSLKENLLDE